MPADTARLSEAWKLIPSPGSVEFGGERFTGARMERILQVVVALGSAVIGAQSVLVAVEDLSSATTAHLVAMAAVFVPLAVMLVACVVGRGVGVSAALFAVAGTVVLAAWPQIALHQDAGADQPWIFFLVNIAVAAAILAFPLRMQITWAVGIPFVYGYARLAEGGFARSYWTTTAFDVSFTLILGLVLVSLAWMCRAVAAGVDEARSVAVAAYAEGAAELAAEEERAAVAALMHDSVLAALIAAERADGDRARELAVSMAREALTRLANAEGAGEQEGHDEPVDAMQIVLELRRALSELGADAVVERRGGPAVVPGRVALAVALAARQAMLNAVHHAQGRGLHVVVDGIAAEGIEVTVSDSGPGFEIDAVPDDRLGVRASILTRMAGVAGTAHIDSDEGGTTVVLRWERG